MAKQEIDNKNELIDIIETFVDNQSFNGQKLIFCDKYLAEYIKSLR